MKKITLKLMMATLVAMLSINVHAQVIEFESDGIYYSDANSDYYTIYRHDLCFPVVEVIKGENKYTDEVVIPESVEYDGTIYHVGGIQEMAFYECEDLISVEIPNGVKEIGFCAFTKCSKLESVTIPNSVESIGHDAFYGCSSLTSVSIGDGVTQIPWAAFAGCSNLTSVSIGKGVTSIVPNAFNGCDNITKVALNCQEILATNYTEEESPMKNLFGDQVKSYIIGSAVTSIGENVFAGCRDMTSVVIGRNIESIADDAFYKCFGLTDIYCYVEDPQQITATIYAFRKSNISNITLHVPESSIEAYETTIPWTSFEDPVRLPNTILYNIDKKNKTAEVAEGKANMLGEAIISESVEYNGVIYPVTSIGQNAFRDCHDLTYVSIPNSVTSIGWWAFLDCRNLTSINIPESVISIDGSAFEGTPWFNSFEDGLIYINKTAFRYKGEMPANTHITIKDGTTSISASAFNLCNGLTSIDIPESVTFIGMGAFIGTGLTSIDMILNRITSISSWTFSNCGNLTSVNIPKNITSIGEDAFSNSSVTSVTIPNSVTEIGQYAFQNCKKMSSISIPESVTSIGGSAFARCNNLTDFYCYIEDPQQISIDDYDFYDVDLGKATLYVPATSIEAYSNAEVWKNFGKITELPKIQYLVDGKIYKTITIPIGEDITPEVAPTKKGYTFSGWSEIPVTMPGEDVTITGSFTVNKYTLTYKVDGEKYKSVKVKYGQKITPEAEPTKKGYTFSGWSEIPAKMPAKNVTVTGSFTVNKYTLTYKVDGEKYKSVKVKYGQKITPEAEPTKEGYTFSGWSKIPTTMPAKNVTVTGTFTLADDIDDVIADDDTYQIYTLDGKPVDDLQKGVNIIRMGDGTTKKVYVK